MWLSGYAPTGGTFARYIHYSGRCERSFRDHRTGQPQPLDIA